MHCALCTRTHFEKEENTFHLNEMKSKYSMFYCGTENKVNQLEIIEQVYLRLKHEVYVWRNSDAEIVPQLLLSR